MAIASKQQRFMVLLDEADYTALRELGESQKASLSLQCLVRLAVENVLDQHAAKQLSFSLVHWLIRLVQRDG